MAAIPYPFLGLSNATANCLDCLSEKKTCNSCSICFGLSK
uniref:Uncharacterized protein n=1 Tax=Rhizophora mucronata TaxID=61149 RepID=A0A2P2P584_RHIMU